MSKSGQLQISRTATVPEPNAYMRAINGEFGDWCFDEERAPRERGRWRERVFKSNQPLDLEIGTGNGTHFAERAFNQPHRNLLGLELRYKPLIQTIRRARALGAVNARVARFNAYQLEQLFAPGELDDVFTYFPDPWERQRQFKHRLIQDDFLSRLFRLQRPGSRLYFKTDSRSYFDWAVERFRRSFYTVEACTYDLHASEFLTGNFVTQFESYFVRQNIPIGWVRLRR